MDDCRKKCDERNSRSRACSLWPLVFFENLPTKKKIRTTPLVNDGESTQFFLDQLSQSVNKAKENLEQIWNPAQEINGKKNSVEICIVEVR